MTEEKKEEIKEEAEKKEENASQEEVKEEKKEESPEKDSPKEEKEAEKKEDKPEEAKDEEEEVEVPEKFKSLVEEIEKMSVLDLSELVKILEKKFGVSASAQVVATAPAGQGGEAGSGGGEEKSVFKVELTGIGDKKIEVIKVVRDLMGKGLKEAKDLVDAVASGAQVIKENAKKDEAEEIKKKFQAAGATVELK